MAIIGATEAKVTPIITGRRMPNFQKPKAWISVARPAANRSALIRNASWSLGSLSAPPTIRGTATVPAYITRTCCNPSASRRPEGKRSLVRSVGTVVLAEFIGASPLLWFDGNATSVPVVLPAMRVAGVFVGLPSLRSRLHCRGAVRTAGVRPSSCGGVAGTPC
ncbi:hypothetical protein D3C72_1547970 [compost metagenome]